VVERWQIRKWECPVVFSWFPVGVSFIAFICYSVGVCIYMYVGDCVCGERNLSSSSSCVVVVGR